MSQHDDFEFLELRRSHAQRHEVEKPAERHVALRHEHMASRARLRPNSTHARIGFAFAGNLGLNVCALQAAWRCEVWRTTRHDLRTDD